MKIIKINKKKKKIKKIKMNKKIIQKLIYLMSIIKIKY